MTKSRGSGQTYMVEPASLQLLLLSCTIVYVLTTKFVGCPHYDYYSITWANNVLIMS